MKIPIDKAQPGMVLSDDVTEREGNTLLARGTELREHHVQRLRRHGAVEVSVEDRTVPPEIRDSVIGAPRAPAEETAVSHPSISVAIIDRDMVANVTIEPRGQGVSSLSGTDLLAALSEHGVTAGIVDHLLSKAVRDWQTATSAVTVVGVARGRPPRPGSVAKFAPSVPCLTTASDITKAGKATHGWQLKDRGISAGPVVAGTEIASKGPDTPPVPGFNVRGDALNTDEMVGTQVVCGEGAEFGEDGTVVIASRAGVPYFEDGRVGVVSLSLDGTVEVAVAEDRMSATVTVHAACEGGRVPAMAEVVDILGTCGVVHGIDEKALQSACERFSKNSPPVDAVVVAGGTAPRAGKNGSIEFRFDPSTSLKPKTNANGSVDFRQVNLVHAVGAGTELARLVPPEPGTAGTDVTGNVVPAADGKAAALPVGPGTRVSETDPAVLVAEVDGNARYANQRIEVAEGLVIDGNVDYSCGNIKYDKTVVVRGDVKSGFRVECGGDLEVQGTVEDAEIVAGGSVLIKGGFVGHGKGLIAARGDVNMCFAQNQRIEAHGKVVIAKEAINCTIRARRTVVLNGDPVSVVGGSVVARDEILVYATGSETGTRTDLEVGLDFALVPELEQTRSTLAREEEKLRELEQGLHRLEELRKRRRGEIPAREDALKTKLSQAIAALRSETDVLKKRASMIERKMYNYANAVVRVDHAAHPGTHFRFGRYHLKVLVEMVGPKVVRLVEDQVQAT